ncbi:MAG: DUF4271 domain-containing protein [Flavipsychrobacter sp.]|nr:DUF4271 domain-containing protein [Flavipsychrobacter sp.]
MRFLRQLYFIFLLLCALPVLAPAKVFPEKYGVVLPYDSAALRKMGNAKADSILRSHPQVALRYGTSGIMKHKPFSDRTKDFYVLAGLFIMLGLIRYSDPKYFNGLLHAFWNPTRSNRQLKDQLQATRLSNLLMNIFFAMSAGAYVYYVICMYQAERSGALPPAVLLALLMGAMGLIYLGKYSVIRFSGWAFRLEGITDFYLFNVFLINKIIAIVLLPFIALLAFANFTYTQPLAILSFVLIGVLLVNRYTRSWQVFGSFFQYSKFHFFMYLCASELLPLAVLVKLLVRGMLSY